MVHLTRKLLFLLSFSFLFSSLFSLLFVCLLSHSYYGGDEIVETSNALCHDRDLRSLIYRTKHHVGMEQNARSLQALEELLVARQSLAKLLGFESYADMQVREGDRVLSTKERVVEFFTRTRTLMEPEIAREKKLLERELVGGKEGVQLWDLAYCSGKARRRVQTEKYPTSKQSVRLLCFFPVLLSLCVVSCF
jgi:Zn-dependent oligopeptidase